MSTTSNRKPDEKQTKRIQKNRDLIRCRIKLTWDPDASVWIATSKDVQGLVLESGSFDGLIERVRYAVPELLQLNQKKAHVIDYTFVSKRNDTVAVYV